MNLEYRRLYVTSQCEDADLTPIQTELAITAAMSVNDDLDDDSFEQMVEDIISGMLIDYNE